MAGLGSIDYVVLVMLENRSFDHMLGFLYPKSDIRRRKERRPAGRLT